MPSHARPLAQKPFFTRALLITFFLSALVAIAMLAGVSASGPRNSIRELSAPMALCVNPGGTGGCFASIQAAVNAASSGDTINVAAGTYAESVLIGKSLTLLGAQAGQNAVTRFAAFTSGIDGPKADPSVESVITATAVNPTSNVNNTIHINADNITVDGFVVDGNNPGLAQGGAVVVGGINTDSRRAIETENAAGTFFAANNVSLNNNIIQNFAQRGIELVNGPDSVSAPATTGSVINGNLIRNFSTTGIVLAFNAYADVTSNTIIAPDGADAAVMVQDYTNSSVTPRSINITNNTITVGQDSVGLWANLMRAPGAAVTTVNISNNTVNAAVTVTGASDFTFGIYLTSLLDGTTPQLTANIVGASGGQFARGIALWNLPTTTATALAGGTVGNSVTGVSVHDNDPNFGLAGANSAVNTSGVSISGTTVGVLVDATGSTGDTVAMQILGNTSISNSTTAISVVGANASANIHDNSIFANGTSLSFTNGGSGAAHFNRIISTTTAIANPNNLTPDLENNWWGCNLGPGNSGCGAVSGTGADFNPWIVLGVSASPNPIVAFGSSTVTADMTRNSNAIVPVGTIPNMPVNFSATQGTMAPVAGTITGGQAMSTFTSTSTNNGTACSTVDGQLVCTSITVTPPSCVAPATVYVDDSWVGTVPGTDPDGVGPATNFGCDSFPTIQSGVTAVPSGGTVIVRAGVYTEDVTINKIVTLNGAQVGVNPNDGSWNDTRTNAANESIIHGAVNLSLRNNIVMDGFTFERTATNEGHILIGSGNPTGVGTSSSFNIKNNRFVGTRNTGTAWAGIHTNFLDDNTMPGAQFTSNQNRIEIAGSGSGSGILINANRPGTDGLGSTTITATYVANSPGNGFNVNRPGGSALISGNRVVNDDIFTFRANNTVISGNTVSGAPQSAISNTGGSTTWSATSNTITNPTAAAVLVGSTFTSDPVTGITVSGNTVTVNSALLTNNFSLFDFRGNMTGTNLLQNNTLTMTGVVGGAIVGVYGVRVRGDVRNLTVSGNTLQGGNPGGAGDATLPASSGVFVDNDAVTALLDLHVQNNSINGWANGVSIFDTIAGVPVAGVPPVQIVSNTITGNTTGVRVEGQGMANLNFNRIVGNSANGTNNVDGTVTAENNWWGCNAGPGNIGCNSVSGTVDFNPWLVLGVSASPSSIPPSGMSTITADMRFNSNTVNTSGSGTLPLTPVAWSATEGTMASPTGTITAGQAMTTYTSTSSNNGTACATVDNQFICTNVTKLPTTETITPAGGSATVADNDYTRINNAIQSSFAGQTIKLNGVFNWVEINAAASWALGSDGVASTGDDYTIAVPANLNNVTLTADNLGDASIQGPGDLAGANLESVLAFNGEDNQNWTISNLRFLDFDLSIGMFDGPGGTDAHNNTNITNNYIRIARDLNATVAPADVNQNIGIHFSFGTNQVISGNTIEIQGDGVSDSANSRFATDVGMQSNTSGGNVYDGLQITNNIIRVLNAQSADPQVILGIWENAHGHTSNITVSGNQFINQAAANNPTTNLQRGFRVTSHSSATTTVIYQNNTVTGANIGFQWFAGASFAGNQPVKLTSNTITNGATGVLVQSQGLANLSFNRIVGNTVNGLNNVDGIVTAENNWWGCNAGPGNAGCDGVTGIVDFNPWLVLGISASPTTVLSGGSSTVTADMTNNSDGLVPSGTVFVPATLVTFGATEGTMFPTTGTLSSGQTASNFTSNSANNGSASATVDNQTVSTLITVIPPAVLSPVVTGTKSVSGAFAPGDTITYTVVLSNTGPGAQLDNPGNEFSDVLPSGLTLVSATATSGTAVATVGSNTVTWNGNIPSSSSVTITITATINSNIIGTIISNQGSINYDADGNGTNDSNSLTDDPTVGGPTSATNFTVCSANPVVTTNADNGAGSLRQAIIDACDGTTITFAPALSGQTITLTTAQLTINKSVTIQGPGATMLTVSGNNGFRVFNVTATGSAVVSISGLTIANGVDTFSSPSGAGISNNGTATVNITGAKLSGNVNDASGGSGGGVANNSTGTVNVTNSTFDHNNANGHFGGGIYNGSTGTVNVTNSTFDTNSGGSGGGIASAGGGTLKVTNSTFTGNSSTGQGGAIYSSTGTLTVEGSTISGNSAFRGGGITRGGSAGTLGDSIVALNIGTAGSGPNPDLDGAFTSEGYNLIGNNTGATITATTGDQIGTQFAQIDPKLDTLKDNGGLTRTMALLTTSPAIDKGKNLAALATDQRGAGFPRPYDDPSIANAAGGDGSDIGAWEGPQPQLITVNTHAPANATYNTSFTVAATASSGLAVSYSSSGSCTNVGATFTMTSGSGTCTVKYDQAGNTNFNAAPQVTEIVNAQKANQSLSVGTHAPAGATYNTSFTVAAAATSGLAVAYSSAGVCTNVGATFTMTSGAGTCTVRYDQPGNANYNAASQLTESVAAQKANQIITVGTHAPANATFNTSFTVAATSNSSLAVAYSSAGVCTNVGATFTMTSGTGTCTVKYDQAGNTNYNAATQVTESVTAQQASTSTGLASSLNPSTLGQSVTFTATVTSSGGTPTGTVQFTIDGVNSGSPVALNGSGVAQLTTSSLTVGTHTVAAAYSGGTNFTVSTGSLAGGQVVSNRPLISLSQSNYNVSEVTGFVTVTVNRTGDLSGSVTVDYATDDTGSSIVCSTLNSGLAAARCDFGLTLGTLRFAATETQKSFAIPITQDSFTEGPETFNVNLTNPTGTNAILAGPSSATVTISDSPAPAPNANDDTDAFVRQQYRDFLSREADPSGLAFWKNNIDECNDPARRPAGMTLVQCIEVRRIDTSAAFFLSIEFQQTGNLVRSFYVASLNRPLTNNMPAFVEFERDRQAIATGIIVGQGNWQQALLNNRDAFLRDFVTRPELVGLYPTTDTPTQYVDKLYLHASITPSSSERAAAIAEFGGAATAADAAARGRALFDVTQNATFQQREANRSFVQMEYFGYLRRNPNDAPDGDYAGYDFWLTKLNAAGGNYISTEMVKAFLSSIEYRKRFGP